MVTRAEIVAFDDEPPPEGKDPWVVPPRPRPIDIARYDERWPVQANAIARRLREALGMRALRIEHIGSTSVPGLPAKPVIDLDVMVADPTDESAWLPPLEADGFLLTVREPWWYGHRMVTGSDPDTNVHVFGPDSPEVLRHTTLRDWLRTDAGDRHLYARTKQDAAKASTERGELTMDYNQRKHAVVREIYERAFRASGLLD